MKNYLKPNINIYKIKTQKIMFSISGNDIGEEFSKQYTEDNNFTNYKYSIWED